MYIIDFEVSGAGSFPYDMLRYDACHPISGENTAAMVSYPGDVREVRTVKLRTYSATKAGRQLTPDRWQSFGWTLNVRSIQIRKA